MPTTAIKPARQPHTTPIGTGQLHQALEDQRDLERLHSFCRAQACSPGDVSTDGKRLDMLKVFDLMRQRGFAVGTVERPQQQLRKGFTTWTVRIALPAGPSFTLGFQTPNTS